MNIQPPTRRKVRVKICGLRTPEDARQCAALDVDFAGLNFVPGARRRIDLTAAEGIAKELCDVVPVAVVRNQSFSEMRAIAASGIVAMIQLHGDETPEVARQLASICPVVKAIDMRHVNDTALMAAYAETVAAFVVDGRDPGSGKAWRWADLTLRDGQLFGVDVWLAGGLRADNVADAVAAVAPIAVDVASGVERVDPRTGETTIHAATLAEFVAAARSGVSTAGEMA